MTPTWSGGSAPGSHGRHTSDEASSGDEDARKEKRRRFEEHRRSHYQMKQALQRWVHWGNEDAVMAMGMMLFRRGWSCHRWVACFALDVFEDGISARNLPDESLFFCLRLLPVSM